LAISGPAGRRRIMEVFVSPDTELADSEFDLDVKLEPVARHLSEERAQRPTECSCVQCDTNAQTCTCVGK
jgi:hypothetical protein